jgi:phosphoribosylformylglycinamidine synthase subunit PurL
MHTSEIIEAHGLSTEEYKKILNILDREPNLTELGIFSVMWSEHCSYKSTRHFLKQLHTQEDWVICGPGENAGIIDIGDNQAAIFKMESHNHPSFIEPYQGAATGVGGIMRDVFTMGARPIAILDSLRFGEYEHKKTAHLLSGVSAGISGYGNCVGVPNIGGNCHFDKSYNENILVNAMCIGLADQDKIFYSAASQIGSNVIYVGAKTGRDGIHGATMASKEFDDDSQAQRPTVQVGDPFKEKLLIEACLELMQHDAILAIQDMGAAGLTCSSLEMADKGNTGFELDLDKVPQREENMTAYEMLLSESQERMLMVIQSGKEQLAADIFDKWELDHAIVGRITDSKRFIVSHNNRVEVDIPVSPLSEEAPIYRRIWQKPITPKKFIYNTHAVNHDFFNVIEKLLSCPDIASKKTIYSQYDSQVMNDTLLAHNISTGVVRINSTNKALAATTDCTSRYVKANPYQGTMQAVIASYRNLIVRGAQPLAITNCLNFGNPEKPEIMGQIVESIHAIRDASKFLKYPVISGNVSLYNETNGEAIHPTPNIGGVGLIEDVDLMMYNHFTNQDEDIFVVGDIAGYLGRSLFQREILKTEEGDSPSVNLELEKLNADFIFNLIQNKTISCCNDISDGGLIITMLKMCFINNIGFSINKDLDLKGLSEFEYFFAEDQARYIVTTNDSQMLTKLADDKGVMYTKIGSTINNHVELLGKKHNILDYLNIFNNSIKL